MQATDIRKLMEGKRFEPKTARQWEQAEAGAAACDRDWEAGNMPAFANSGLADADRFYRAAYELRYHEILGEMHRQHRDRTALLAANLPDFTQYPPRENIWDAKCYVCEYEVQAHRGVFAPATTDPADDRGFYLHPGCFAGVRNARNAGVQAH